MISSVLCISGNASINNGSAIVTFKGLKCGVPYTIIAGGVLNNGSLVGPRSSRGVVNTTNNNGTCEAVDNDVDGDVDGDDDDDGDDGDDGDDSEGNIIHTYVCTYTCTYILLSNC